MTESSAKTHKQPSLFHSIICFGGVVLLIALGLFRFEIDLHSLLFLCLLWAGFNSRLLACDYLTIQGWMSESISRALTAIYIFILIGMVISSFMHSGTIATLIYYGLELLSPSLFLVVGLLLCSFMSIATGTSWGTAGTIGVVLIGIGEVLGIPLPLVAGMIVSGASFGDKLSPISDTTNLAAMSSGTSLYEHIRSMLYTTVPTMLIVLVIFFLLGLRYTQNDFIGNDFQLIQQALSEQYRLSIFITLLPLLVMLILSVRRLAAELAMSASIVTAVLIAIVYQGEDLVSVLNALWLNTLGTTGIETLDSLLGRGGISSMAWTLLLALMALALGGILHSSGFLKTLLAGIIVRVKRTTTLIATTLFSGLIGNMAMGEAYISIILNCQLFSAAFAKKGLNKAVLSRSVEEGSTLTTALIPWTTAGAFYAATLGVSVLDYLPYALFNYLNAIVSISLAMFGFGLLKTKQES